MTKTKLPQSLRKYIRKEKARLKREFLDKAEYEKAVLELLQRVKHPRALGVIIPRAAVEPRAEEPRALSEAG